MCLSPSSAHRHTHSTTTITTLHTKHGAPYTYTPPTPASIFLIHYYKALNTVTSPLYNVPPHTHAAAPTPTHRHPYHSTITQTHIFSYHHTPPYTTLLPTITNTQSTTKALYLPPPAPSVMVRRCSAPHVAYSAGFEWTLKLNAVTIPKGKTICV